MGRFKMEKVWINTDYPGFFNDICETIRLFIFAETIELSKEIIPPRHGWFFLHTITKTHDDKLSSNITCYKDKKLVDFNSYLFFVDKTDKLIAKRNIKFGIRISFYLLLKNNFKKKLPWGALTGIRPTKMLRDMGMRMGEDKAMMRFKHVFDVSSEKLALVMKINDLQKPYVESANERTMAIYIGIPFCPSICHYCSFGSNKVKRGDALQVQYVGALIKEIDACEAIIKAHDIRSIYIGGGTPTSLDNDVFEKLLKAVTTKFDCLVEFTVEAGRPDTLTEEKIKIMKAYGVNRISVNPQTFNQKTLDLVGRKHTTTQMIEAYDLARSFGMKNINMDLIFGLPNENLRTMKKSLRKAMKLAPESITVHTLAIKNAAKLKRGYQPKVTVKKLNRAVTLARKKLGKAGFLPYYMYRQKYMMGNLENVGYAKQGFECIYNIDMMEESCSVLAFGAGAISKRVFLEENRLARCPNVKGPKLYIARIDDMIEKKKKHFSES
jgi:coproporphyrinogen dehydrogenase HemZ